MHLGHGLFINLNEILNYLCNLRLMVYRLGESAVNLKFINCRCQIIIMIMIIIQLFIYCHCVKNYPPIPFKIFMDYHTVSNSRAHE